METKVFSGRTDANKLQYADLLCNQELGISFGKYCSRDLVNFIYETGTIPELHNSTEPNDAISVMQQMIAACTNQKKDAFSSLSAGIGLSTDTADPAASGLAVDSDLAPDTADAGVATDPPLS